MTARPPRDPFPSRPSGPHPLGWEAAFHILPIWRRIRAILFEPARTAERGWPWEDVQ